MSEVLFSIPFQEEKPSAVRFAYDMTIQELLSHTKPVTTFIGKQIRPDEPAKTKIREWRSDVERAKSHTTKILRDEVLRDYYGDDKPRFTWSPSKLMTFETCPAKFAAESYYKTVPYEESEQAIWGTRVHKAAEYFMSGVSPYMLGTNFDPDAFAVVKDYCKVLDRLPGERLIEHKMALTEDFRPTDWDNGCARMILDLGFVDGDTIRAYDWKTGKMKEDVTQMQIYAYTLAILFPQVRNFDFKYIWLKDKKTTGFKCSRKELIPVAQDLRVRIARMKTAWDNEVFREVKNGLCKSWCGNVSCAHNGRK